MKINQKTIPNQSLIKKAGVKVEKEETQVKDEFVESGDKPAEELDPATILGCALVGGVARAAVSGTVGGISGGFNALVGWGAKAIGGPVGGAVATGVMGGFGFYRGFKKPDEFTQSWKNYFGIKQPSSERRVLKGVVRGATSAASTFLGSEFGAAGVIYGGLVAGGVHGLIGGAKTFAALT